MDKFFKSLNEVFIVAEISANHGNSIEIAINTIKAAKRAGADAIKLQTYTPDTITINSNNKDFIINSGSIWDNQNLYSLYSKAYTPWEWHSKLFQTAKEEGLICFSSPFDRSAVDLLEKLENPIYKIASFEITDIPLIDYVASKDKPIILSTGIAEKSDIQLALDTIRNKNSNEIVLLKCTSSYPSPLEDCNLLTIVDYFKNFDIIPGLSDHTLGITAPIVATTLGAKVIEKHFIIDKSVGGPDSSFSLDEKEFKEMVIQVRNAEKAIGEITYDLTDKQQKSRNFSRSLYVIKNVKKGELISEDNVKSIRPGFGMHPKYFIDVLGKRFSNNFSKGTRLTKQMFK